MDFEKWLYSLQFLQLYLPLLFSVCFLLKLGCAAPALGQPAEIILHFIDTLGSQESPRNELMLAASKQKKLKRIGNKLRAWNL